MSRQTGCPRDYDVDPFAAMLTSDGRVVNAWESGEVLVSPRTVDRASRLRPKEWVLGLRLGARAHCIPLGDRAEEAARWQVSIGGQQVMVTRGEQPWEAWATDLAGDLLLPQVVCWYFAWYAAFPDTLIWQGDGQERLSRTAKALVTGG